MLIRSSVVVVIAALVGVGLARPGVPSPEPTVSQFLLAWESQHYLEAAELTTGPPKTVAAALARAYERLDASNVILSIHGISQQAETARAQFGASIDLGGTGLVWTYQGAFALRDGSSGWRVVWSPSVIVPGMTDKEQLAVYSAFYPRSQLLDSAGRPLGVPSKVDEVGVVPDTLTNPARTAAALAAITQIPQDQIQGQIEQTLQGDFLELITYTPAQYAALRARLATVPGLQVRERTERLFKSIAPNVVGTVGNETAAVLRKNGVEYRPGTTVGLSGLQQTFQRQLTGTPRTEVVLQQSGQAAVKLHTWPGAAGTPVRTTLSAPVQVAADRALAGIPTSAAIVAVQSGTGKILAVASTTPNGSPALDPLSGAYEPGQAFMIVSSAAILSNGGLAPTDPVPCPSSNTVGGQTFTNDPPEPNLGSAPSFRTDFAHGCATAFAGGLSLSLNASQLASASHQFGLGGWQLPVSGSFAGQLGTPAGQGVLAADMIGTGDVRVSPLDMALVASVVDSGRWQAPSLVTGLSDPRSAARAPISAQVLSSLRGLMRAAMSTPTNRVADVGGNVYGQAGSAPFGSGHGRHIYWFVGYQGNIAFAVALLGSSASDSAVPLAGSFLHNLKAGY
ncbi:MAG TPA: penicillin-binding transpeptidase domain-containing protein [Streptosporangiaceae bacterium]|nr:penicillin-binding transpeptidase domain-containing protein [Streptosporangiaceae bacterium]